MTKLLNNFKNYSKMVQESKKDLPPNFGHMRTGYINPSGRISYINRSTDMTVKKTAKKVTVISVSDFFESVLYNRLKTNQVFSYYACEVSQQVFFKLFDIEWFKNRFGFETIKEIKESCNFFVSQYDGKGCHIVEIKNRYNVVNKYLLEKIEG